MLREELDSNEEWHFTWFLDELKSKGYVKDYFKIEEGYVMSNDVKVDYIKPMKRVANKKMQQVVMRGHVYTPDFKIIWDPKALGILVQDLNSNKKITTKFICQDLESIIEIKGIWDMNNMTRLATNNIKSLYDKHGIFCQIIKIPTLFKNTFTPLRYFYTDGVNSNKRRKIKFKTKTLNEWEQEIK